MKAIMIKALTPAGVKGLEIMKGQCSSFIVKQAFKRLKTSVEFADSCVFIHNPSMEFCTSLEHEKSRQGINEIVLAFSEIGAVENKDFEIKQVRR